jgi:hypothetical protein
LKICFIAGKKKSGKCGITDYVDLLAQKLETQGHTIEKIFLKNCFDYLPNLPPADLYSIQFAPYAFAPHGMPMGVLRYLAQGLKKKKVHLNIHEIWIAAYPRAKWKEKIIGWIQKRLILRFINKSKPTWITSSNAAAIDRLKNKHVSAKFLYLFGNIPFSPSSKVIGNHEIFKVAFFGTPYSDFPYHRLIDFLTDLSNEGKRVIEINLIGRQRENSGKKRLINLCKENGILINITGELTNDLISQQLQSCSLGVSTTPYDIIGKSGATAAMLEHGLPILAYDDGDTPQKSLFIIEQFKDQLYFLNDDSSVKKLLQIIEKPKNPFFDGVAYTAKKMLEIVH